MTAAELQNGDIMGSFQEYEHYDALGLAELVHQKQVSPTELCEAAIEKIDHFNPVLNAVVTRMYEEGCKRASDCLPDGPFAGVPFLLKDLNFAYSGYPLTKGCRALKNYLPGYDSEMVLRFKKTGVIVLGKTNTPELGLMGVTEPEFFGACRNPWNIQYSPGGSSGGTAAAVAAGMVPMAAGGDGGGSIRIPSSFCGLFGLKPSTGRNPNGPEHARVWQGAVQNHVITRSVRDSAAMLDATQGPDTGAPYEIRPPVRPYLEEVTTNPGRLKIAFNTQSPIGTSVQPDCIHAVEDAALLLEELGHHVEAAQPHIDGPELARSYMAMYFGEVAADLDELSDILGRKVGPGDVELLTWTLGLLGRSFSSGYFVDAMRRWDLMARKMGHFFETYDLYLTPTTAYSRIRIGELNPKPSEALMLMAVNKLRLGWLLRVSGLVDKMALRSLERTPFTQVANLCGLPAMSIPLYWTPDGMPCGVHFIGKFGEERTLFRLAGQLEKSRPWFDKRPVLVDS